MRPVTPIAAGDDAAMPLVSVCMITYNHEAYLRQAVESVLEQQTSFPYELVIGEDSSPDGTREIAAGFERAWPEVVRLLPSSERLGLNKNFERTLAACRGKYVALLEGDDFWTSPHKLQRQVEVLEKCPEVSLVFHPVEVRPDSGKTPSRVFPKSIAERTGIRNILRFNYIPTPSVMARNPRLTALPDWFQQTYMTDWPFFLHCASRGEIHFIREPMATYRVTGNGVWTSISRAEQTRHWLAAYLAADREFSHCYHDVLLPNILNANYSLAVAYWKTGRPEQAKEHMRAFFDAAPFWREWKRKVRLFLSIECPPFWGVLQRLRGRPA